MDALGRRPQKQKVEQLANWPEPVDQAALTSFLCFANYLREYLPPDWVNHEQTLRPFRKKGCDFKKLWASNVKCVEAFREIRRTLAGNVVILHHINHVAASRPHESGRPLEMFIDASDFGWAGVLCQRPEPGKAPKIISVLAKGFSDVQQRLVGDGA